MLAYVPAQRLMLGFLPRLLNRFECPSACMAEPWASCVAPDLSHVPLQAASPNPEFLYAAVDCLLPIKTTVVQCKFIESLHVGERFSGTCSSCIHTYMYIDTHVHCTMKQNF